MTPHDRITLQFVARPERGGGGGGGGYANRVCDNLQHVDRVWERTDVQLTLLDRERDDNEVKGTRHKQNSTKNQLTQQFDIICCFA